jgi:phenylpyruvate tautomerase PptA (4-oxalocrotonate tautomerase family)
MPQININIGKKISDETKELLQNEIANCISTLPGKSKEGLIVCIVDDCATYKNSQRINCAFIDVRLFRNSTEEGKHNFTLQLYDITNRILDIPVNYTYINFIELQEWGLLGVYKTAKE